MAFSWTTIDDGTIITSAQWDEIKTNVDTLTSNLGIAAYTWSELPVTADVNTPDIPDLQELRNALDYVNDNNTCSSYNAALDSTVNSGRDISVNNSVYSSRDSSENSTVNLSLYSTVYNPHCSTNYSSRDSTVDSNKDTTNYSTKYTSVLTTKYNTVYSDLHSPYNSGANASVISDIRLKKDIVYI